jgi:hypothetical protein
MCLQLVQLRCRPTMRGPADARLGAATASTEKSGKPHDHPAEQRRDLVKPPVLDVTSTAAGRAIRPQNRMMDVPTILPILSGGPCCDATP